MSERLGEAFLAVLPYAPLADGDSEVSAAEGRRFSVSTPEHLVCFSLATQEFKTHRGYFSLPNEQWGQDAG